MSNPEASRGAPQPSQDFSEEQLTALSAETGFTASELLKEYTFGKYHGTMAQILIEPECPVGDIVRDEFREAGGHEGAGREAVIAKVQTFSLIDKKFQFVPDEDVKKNSMETQETEIFRPRPNL